MYPFSSVAVTLKMLCSLFKREHRSKSQGDAYMAAIRLVGTKKVDEAEVSAASCEIFEASASSERRKRNGIAQVMNKSSPKLPGNHSLLHRTGFYTPPDRQKQCSDFS